MVAAMTTSTPAGGGRRLDARGLRDEFLDDLGAQVGQNSLRALADQLDELLEQVRREVLTREPHGPKHVAGHVLGRSYAAEAGTVTQRFCLSCSDYVPWPRVSTRAALDWLRGEVAV